MVILALKILKFSLVNIGKQIKHSVYRCLIHFCLLVQFCCWNSDLFHHTDAQSWLQTNCAEQELHFFNFRSTGFSPLQHEYFYCDSSQNQDKFHTSCTLQHAVVLTFTLRFCKQFLHLFIAFALLLCLRLCWILCEILYAYVIDLFYFINLF